jgi:hypothetical protein
MHVCPCSAHRSLSDRKENGTANYAEHAKGGGALQGEDDAFDESVKSISPTTTHRIERQ